MFDIIIAGGGPAGLTAAIYARRAAKTVLVLEAATCGGQIINTPDIENYPVAMHISGMEFGKRLEAQAKELGAEIKFERVLGIESSSTEKTVLTKKNRYTGKALILSTGSENRKLGLEHEDKLVGRGISYCATCDGAFYKNKTVAVVGGGNTALEDALYLTDLAETVYLIHRRDELRGDEATAALLREKKNLKLILSSNVTKLNAGKRLESIEVTDRDGNVSTLEVNGLFVAVGRIPENQSFAQVVALDDGGYIPAGEDCRTNVPGIFVAGDNRAKAVRQLVTATADGAVAATEAVKYVNLV